MENNQVVYYTPELEDLRIGYEYQQHALLGINLDKTELREWQQTKISNPVNLYDILNHIEKEKNTIRVPYLTRDQIRAEGWFPVGDTDDKVSGWFYKDHPDIEVFNGEFFLNDTLVPSENYDLFFDEKTRMVMISDVDGERLFNSVCKSINEFRYIIKILNIK